jgi:hypothetical protein
MPPSPPTPPHSVMQPLLSHSVPWAAVAHGLRSPEHPFSIRSTHLRLPSPEGVGQPSSRPGSITNGPLFDDPSLLRSSFDTSTPPGHSAANSVSDTPVATPDSSRAQRLLSFPSKARSDYNIADPTSSGTSRGFRGLNSLVTDLEASSTLLGSATGSGVAGGIVAHAAMVADAEPEDFMVLLRRVSKVYHGGWCSMSRGEVAIDDVSLAIPEGHCFGLLGVFSSCAVLRHGVAMFAFFSTPVYQGPLHQFADAPSPSRAIPL